MEICGRWLLSGAVSRWRAGYDGYQMACFVAVSRNGCALYSAEVSCCYNNIVLAPCKVPAVRQRINGSGNTGLLVFPDFRKKVREDFLLYKSVAKHGHMGSMLTNVSML